MNYFALLVKLSSNDGFEYLGLDIYSWFAIIAVASFFWGFITYAIAANRGYEDEGGKWFLIGFVLGLIGVIIAASTVPRNSQGTTNVPVANVVPLNNNGWRCECGVINAESVGTCSCGRTKPRGSGSVNLGFANLVNSQSQNNAVVNSEFENLERLKKYKELLDIGAITQEEFELKKKEILKIK